VLLVPYRSEHGTEVDADSQSDEIREHDHHYACAEVVVVAVDSEYSRNLYGSCHRGRMKLLPALSLRPQA